MTALERRINKLEALLWCRIAYFAVTAYKRQEEAKAEQRRREMEKAAAAAQAEREEAARRAEASQAPSPPEARPTVLPTAPRPAPPEAKPESRPEPQPPPWTYDPPPEMQIRPVSRGRSEPHRDDSEGTYGRCIVDYDPLADADYDDDS